ncbi:hypothetical protein PR048_004659 [Dryococelus australis]|uniref:Uncharacterized protein n=1 Tax=Dryococelus australis TaxID=614101 RepID=A0ABQ9I5Z8_9NEOP|nr:hypothetical protein PR048_004659 [Dryococelus australis]
MNSRKTSYRVNLYAQAPELARDKSVVIVELREFVHGDPCFPHVKLATTRKKCSKISSTRSFQRSGFNPWLGHSGFSYVAIVPDDAVGRWVFSGICHFPALSFPRCSILASITLIGSQDIDVVQISSLTQSFHYRYISLDRRMKKAATRPMAITISYAAEEHTTCEHVDLKQDFQRARSNHGSTNVPVHSSVKYLITDSSVAPLLTEYGRGQMGRCGGTCDVHLWFQPLNCMSLRVAVTERLDCSPPTKANLVLVGGTMPLVGGFPRGLPFPPPSYSSAAPFSPYFTLIDSQDQQTNFPMGNATPAGPKSSPLKHPSKKLTKSQESLTLLLVDAGCGRLPGAQRGQQLDLRRCMHAAAGSLPHSRDDAILRVYLPSRFHVLTFRRPRTH